jgi:hypothetical protein
VGLTVRRSLSRQLGLVLAGCLLVISGALVLTSRNLSKGHEIDFYIGLFMNLGSGVFPSVPISMRHFPRP